MGNLISDLILKWFRTKKALHCTYHFSLRLFQDHFIFNNRLAQEKNDNTWCWGKYREIERCVHYCCSVSLVAAFLGGNFTIAIKNVKANWT